MAELCYITHSELSRYQEGKPVNVYGSDHKENIEALGVTITPIIISPDLNQVVYDIDDLQGLHLVRRIENNV